MFYLNIIYLDFHKVRCAMQLRRHQPIKNTK